MKSVGIIKRRVFRNLFEHIFVTSILFSNQKQFLMTQRQLVHFRINPDSGKFLFTFLLCAAFAEKIGEEFTKNNFFLYYTGV